MKEGHFHWRVFCTVVCFLPMPAVLQTFHHRSQTSKLHLPQTTNMPQESYHAASSAHSSSTESITHWFKLEQEARSVFSKSETEFDMHTRTKQTEVSTAANVETVSESQADPKKFHVFSDNCSDALPNFEADDGVIELVTPAEERVPDSRLDCDWKVTVSSNMYITVTFLHFELDGPCDVGHLEIQDGAYSRSRKMATLCSESALVPLHASSNALYFRLVVSKFSRYPRLTILFQATETSLFPRLSVTLDSNTTGSITSPGFDGVSHYQSFLDDSYTLRVPEGYVVMVSFSRFHLESDEGCQRDFLSLYAVHDTFSSTLLWKRCGAIVIPTQIYTTSLLFYFHSDKSDNQPGFSARFSLHPLEESPRQLSSGLFDCSEVSYESFRWHLVCNFVVECDRGEDEKGCVHSSDLCHEGLLFNTTCYRYVSWTKPSSWNQASRECQRTGARLATLRTSQEWKAVTTVVNLGKRIELIYVGLRAAAPALPSLYRHTWQWVDQTVAYNASMSPTGHQTHTCAALYSAHHDFFQALDCETERVAHFVCQSKLHNSDDDEKEEEEEVEGVVLAGPELWEGVWTRVKGVVRCQGGHVVRDFLSRDPSTHCGLSVQEPVDTPLFRCQNGDTLSYSLVCDYSPDCPDSSDEDFCVHTHCPEASCRNGQCLAWDQWCDRKQDCRDSSDEDSCPRRMRPKVMRRPPPAVVKFDGYGDFGQEDLRDESCPDTHFQCPGEDGYCLPVFLRCNGVYDCPGWEDEEGCVDMLCPSLFRCRASSLCLHPEHVCDGVYHCPHHDDEILCGVDCPAGCRCQGAEFVCPVVFPAAEYPHLRYLDASRSGFLPEELSQNTFLVYLRLSHCGIKSFGRWNFSNLRILDVSDNGLSSIDMDSFQPLQNLHTLRLSGNPISILESSADFVLDQLENMEMTHTSLHMFDSTVLSHFSRLKSLNLSYNPLDTISEDGLNVFTHLNVLDVRNSQVSHFPLDLFRGLSHLKYVYAENYRLCCADILPDGFRGHCLAPTDELSSCEDLLRSNLYRTFLWIFATLAVVGNGGSLIFRIVIQKKHSLSGFNVFVKNLCLADFVMGVYLILIGSADAIFMGQYLHKEKLWKHSVFCKTAGFLSLLSSEVSALVICLITLDRCITLRLPMSPLRFHQTSAHVACSLAWLVGFLLAVTPLLPFASHWHFFSQTAICLPLPITRNDFPGWGYAFGVMILFNLALFLMVAAGQVAIYWSVRSSAADVESTKDKRQDVVIARRLAVIVLTDFCCWFPIGLLGVMAWRGVPVPGELNVILAIFVLPLNSALNPFLYTLNTVLEKQQRLREENFLQRLFMRTLSGLQGTTTSKL